MLVKPTPQLPELGQLIFHDTSGQDAFYVGKQWPCGPNGLVSRFSSSCSEADALRAAIDFVGH
jgi:hypothetical protein